MLRDGHTLSQVTLSLANALGVPATILPMSDQRVATMVDTNEGELAFQEYFVRRHWEPVVKSVRFVGIEEAGPSPGTSEAIDNADAIVLCPSNPFVSVEPILSVPGMRERIRNSKAVKIAVSPIVGAKAIKGPAGKMFHELGVEPSALAVAKRYEGLLDAFMIDRVDEGESGEITALGMRVLVTDAVMWNEWDRERLGRELVDWATASAAR
jgi:LPPG:FO 2-phospho-L-lactate transferase